MSPQARYNLPPELSGLMRGEMETVISQANLGQENERIAQLYYIDKRPQIDVASELYLGRATVQRRLPGILDRMRKTSSRLYS
jgi:DNA-directed RNA polymerase specialized sigma subunit